MTEMNENENMALELLKAIADIVHKEGAHDYVRTAAGSVETATLCGVSLYWFSDTTVLKARDVELIVTDLGLTFIRGGIQNLQSWHKEITGLDNLYRAA
jgi:hypothetical protein